MAIKKLHKSKRILVITPVPIFPVFGGNRQRIKAICNALMENGFTLDLFYAGFDHPNEKHQTFINGEMFEYHIPDGSVNGDLKKRIREIANGLKIKTEQYKRRVLYGKGSSDHNQSLFDYKNIAKFELLSNQISTRKYRAVLLNYATHTHYFELFDEKTIKILDTHDRLANRYKIFTDHGEKPAGWKSLTPADEKKAINKADVVWAITGNEKDHFINMVEGRSPKVLTIPHLAAFCLLKRDEQFSNKRVLVVSGKGKINISGINWFLENVWPEVISQVPGTELGIAGSICEKKSELSDAEDVNFLGRYNQPEEVYAKADICINPMLYGTGLKIKTLEALSFGKRVVSTREGAAGLMRFSGKGLHCSDSASEWIKILKEYLGQESHCIEFHEALRLEMGKMHNETLSRILWSVEPETHNLPE